MAAEEARRQSSLTVDTHVSLLELKPHIISLCKDLFKKWSELNQSRFSVERISGGMTNLSEFVFLVLKVSVEDETGNAESFAVRLYGPNTEYVINRERELLDLGRSC